MAPKTPGWAVRKERCGLKLQDDGSGSRMGVLDAGKREILERWTPGALKKRPSKGLSRPGCQRRFGNGVIPAVRKAY
jgi:hypothetical protein